MELERAIRARRMVRSFAADPLAPDLVDRLIDLARRAPSAGNTQPVDFVVLEGPAQVASYWEVTLSEERRVGFRWPGLLAAPVLVLPVVRPAAYPDRYAEADKVATGLGEGEERWSVPYWWVDGGMVVQNLLLAVVDAGLGACFFGLFAHEPAVRAALGIPEDRRVLGAVAIGHPSPAAPADRGRSADRPRPPLDAVIHRRAW